MNVTPNHHALALGWSFSDNFYADSEVSVDGHHWLVGAYPDAWTETSFRASYADGRDFRFPTTAPGRLSLAEGNSSVHPEEQPEGGTIWHHLARHGVCVPQLRGGLRTGGRGRREGLQAHRRRFLINVPMPDPLYRNTSRDYPVFNMNIPDQYRATQFIHEIEEKYVKGGEPFPHFIYIHLPERSHDRAAPAGRLPIRSFLRGGQRLRAGAHRGVSIANAVVARDGHLRHRGRRTGRRDHIDAHRTVFMGIGPYFKRNYVSHVNTSFPGMLKTIFRLLGLPPLNLFDAVASDLSDCFTNTPDFEGYRVRKEDPRIFDPAAAREPLDPRPSIKMDDPAEVGR